MNIDEVQLDVIPHPRKGMQCALIPCDLRVKHLSSGIIIIIITLPRIGKI